MKIENEKVIAGLSCGQVLDLLSEYLDGDLAGSQSASLEQHLRGCDGCARFGGEFRGVVGALREHLARSRGLPEGFRERLRRAMEEKPRR